MVSFHLLFDHSAAFDTLITPAILKYYIWLSGHHTLPFPSISWTFLLVSFVCSPSFPQSLKAGMSQSLDLGPLASLSILYLWWSHLVPWLYYHYQYADNSQIQTSIPYLTPERQICIQNVTQYLYVDDQDMKSLTPDHLSFSVDGTSIFPVCSDQKPWNHPQLLFFSYSLTPTHQQI